MRTRRPLALAAALAAATLSLPAWAITPPAHVPSPGLRSATGLPLRSLRTVSWQKAPRAAGAAWRAYRAAHAGVQLAMWDEATGVPTRVWGASTPAPGTSDQGPKGDAAAARVAEALLVRHLDLLAPGASVTDFELVHNASHVSGASGHPTRTVAYAQRHGGLAVLGGRVSFRFAHDRLVLLSSQALPHVAVGAVGSPLSAAAARAASTAWVAEIASTKAQPFARGQVELEGVEGPFVLPLVGARGVHGYATVLRVTARTHGPDGRWEVYLDAATGDRVAIEQTLRFTEGTVLYDVPERWPGGGRMNAPALFAELTVAGEAVTSSFEGVVPLPAEGGPFELLTSVRGSSVVVLDAAGNNATATLSLEPGGTAVWSGADEERVDAQLNAYIHAHRAKDFARSLRPDLGGWLDQKLTVNVNLQQVCNAYYDGSSVNFYVAGGPCENTGRLADVVYHELGHAFHHRSAIETAGFLDSALGEGVADYYATTMTGDPAMGRGFYNSSQPLRHVDPDLTEKVWPQHIHHDPHETGLIIAGALWDLRKGLIADHGPDEGVALADRLFAEAIQHATDIPSMYVEVLAADDDDGDLANGTPNVCTINLAFGRHGLRAYSLDTVAPTVEPPTVEAHRVSLQTEGMLDRCEGDRIEEAKISWRLRRSKQETLTVTMGGGPDAYEGLIPVQDEGEVVQLRVDVQLADGSFTSFPDNPADRYYEFFVGEVVPLYCTDFETDPWAEGWQSALLEGNAGQPGALDWLWGMPQGVRGSGDPDAAFSGQRVLGNDLGGGQHDGSYQRDVKSYAATPVIDVTGYRNIRLQYRRWLNVEDGYFDRASIYANGASVWKNLASVSKNQANVDHVDREWRFHDVDLTEHVQNNAMQVSFEIHSDDETQLGGWTIDDLCIVAYEGDLAKDAACGDGYLDEGEACDDGNLVAGDGCSVFCRLEPVDAEVEEPRLRTTTVTSCTCRVADAPVGAGRWHWPLALTVPLLWGVRRRRRRQEG